MSIKTGFSISLVAALCCTLGAGIAGAAEKSRTNLASPNDPRSGAALNREAALRAGPRLRAVEGQSATRRIHHSTVNNVGADATPQDTQSETTLIDLGGGNLVAAWNDSGAYDGVSGGGNDHFTGYAFSSNNGLSWTDPGNLPASTEGDAGDPVLAAHNATNAVYLSTLGFTTGENLQVFKSTDLGHTFGAPVNGTPGYAGTGDFQDKEWLAVDNFAGPGNGNVYLCWTRFPASGPADIRFTRSVDGGATFGPNLGTVLSPGGQGCFVLVSPNHQVNVFYYRGTGTGGQGGDNKLFMRRSLDQGVTFQPEVVVADLATSTINGRLELNGGLRSNSFPHAAVNPVAARPFLYVIFNDDPNLASSADNGDIYIAFSTNGGASWSPKHRINDDIPGDQFFPTIGFVDGGERLMFSYYSRSHDPSNVMFHRRGRLGSLARAGGIQLNSSFQLSPNTPIVIGQDPVINTTYMGDYDQVAGGAGALSTTWADHRLGNAFHRYQPDVRFARISVPPPASDLALSASVSPASIGLGQNTTITITATASGGAANDVFVNVRQPVGLAVQSVVAASGTCNFINDQIGCSMKAIPAGTSKTIQIVATGSGAGTRTLTALGTTSSADGNTANNSASVDVTVSGGGAVAKAYSSGNIAVPIVSPGTIEIPIDVPVEGTIVNAQAFVRMDHAWVADLNLTLVSPTGKTVDLSSGNGGAGDNYGSGANDCTGTRTRFFDSAATSITAGTPPYAGVFRPEQPLATMVGEPSDGQWRLRVQDTFSADAGVVGCFQLWLMRIP